MKKLEFKTEIKAPKEKVWDVLWDDQSYRKWTTPFQAGSYVETEPMGEWKKGNKVRFLTPKGEGMYSVIDQCDPYKVMSFKHLGEIRDNKDLPLDEKTTQWTGSQENYYLTENNGTTLLRVEVDSIEGMDEFMTTKFPEALSVVKELSETKT